MSESPPPVRTTLSVVRGSVGIGSRAILRGDRRGVHRVRDAERCPAVAAPAAKLHAVAVRTERAVDYPFVAGSVERDRGDRIARRSREEGLRSAEIASALLARGANEIHRRAGAKRVPIDHLREREHHGQTAAVVADPRSAQPCSRTVHLELRAAWKDRVEMRADDHGAQRGTLVSRAARLAGSPSDHVAGRVDPHVRETELAEALGHPPRALALFPRWGRDPRDGHLMTQDLLIEHDERSARFVERLALPELREWTVGSLHGPQLTTRARMRKCGAHHGPYCHPPSGGYIQ